MGLSQQEIEKALVPLQKRYEEGLAFAESFENSLIPSAHVGYDGSWLRVNKALCEYFGYTEKEVVQLTWPDITCDEYIEADWKLVRQCIAGEIDAYDMFKVYLHKDGARLPSTLYVSINRASAFFLSQIMPEKNTELKPVVEALS